MEVREVKTASEFKTFLNLPLKIHTSPDSRFVMPLHLHMKMMIGKLGTPNKHLLLAFENNEAVARLGIKIHEHGGHKTLNFGFFEILENHPEAAKALFKKAHEMYPDLNIMGPFHFRMEDPYVGTLVEGFEKDPYFLMPYNPPYYDEYLKGAGLSKVMDLFTYEIDNPDVINDSTIIHENANQARQKGVSIRYLNPKNLDSEARSVARIFNDALSRNWGFEEFLDEQVNEMVTLFKLFLDSRVVAFACIDGKDVGCLLMLPDYNPMIKSGKGKVTPSIIWKYFQRKKLLHRIRGYALGVLKEYHGYGIGSLLTESMFETGKRIGYHRAEISWILANNGPMNELSKAMGGKHNKVYRVYESKFH